jgi:hypothetical protein
MVGLQHLAPGQEANLMDWWQQSRVSLPGGLRRAFDSAVLLVTWEIWKERNRRTFERVSKTALQLLHHIIEEAHGWMAAGYAPLSELFAAAAGSVNNE